MELTKDVLETARELLDAEILEFSDEEVLFVDSTGFIHPVGPLAAGTRGFFSVVPLIVAICIDRKEIDAAAVEDTKKHLEEQQLELSEDKQLPRSERMSSKEREVLENYIEELKELLEEEQSEEEEISLLQVTSFSEVPDSDQNYCVGAFVFSPSKDGTKHIEKPIVLNSSKELYTCMEHWGLLG